MISTGRDSSGTDLKALDENDTSPHPITSTCRATDATSVLSTFTSTLSGPLIHFSHQRQPLEPCARQCAHHPGDRTVVGLLVGAHEKGRIEPPPRVRGGLFLAGAQKEKGKA